MEKSPGSQLVAAVASGGRRRRADPAVRSQARAYPRQTSFLCSKKAVDPLGSCFEGLQITDYICVVFPEVT